jgi:hypothetical protein
MTDVLIIITWSLGQKSSSDDLATVTTVIFPPICSNKCLDDVISDAISSGDETWWGSSVSSQVQPVNKRKEKIVQLCTYF